MLARQDFYGSGLADSTAKNITAAGANLAKKVLYNADAENFTAEVNEIAASKPDALILISFEEVKKIIPQLIAKGIGPQDIKIYLVDGDLSDYSKESFKLDGVKGTAPSPAELPPNFEKKLKDDQPARSTRPSPTVRRPTTPSCSPRSRHWRPRTTAASPSPTT